MTDNTGGFSRDIKTSTTLPEEARIGGAKQTPSKRKNQPRQKQKLMKGTTHNGENEHQQLVPWKDKRSGRFCQ